MNSDFSDGIISGKPSFAITITTLIKCIECHRTFKCNSDRNRHILQEHSGQQRQKFKRASVRLMSTVPCKAVKCIEASRGQNETIQEEIPRNEIKRYSCTICNEKFVSKFKLEDHELAHGFAPNLKCLSCKLEFTNYILLVTHVQTHAPSLQEKDALPIKSLTNLKCRFCPLSYQNNALLALHKRKVHTAENKCRDFDHILQNHSDHQKQKSESAFVDSLLTDSTENEKSTEPIVDKTDVLVEERHKQMYLQKNDIINQTPSLATCLTILCPKLCPESSLLSPEGSVDKDSSGINLNAGFTELDQKKRSNRFAKKVNLKSKSLDTKIAGTSHVIGSNSTASKPNTLSCMMCNVSFLSRHRHLEHEFGHGTAPNLKCFSCTMTFPTYDLLITHVRTHPMDQLEKDVLALVEPSNLRCLLCPEIFPNYALLALHAKKVHTSQHKCSQCHHMFKFYCDLNRHIIRRHSGMPPFMCSALSCMMCNVSFPSNHRHREHEFGHGVAPNLKCFSCTMTFPTYALLITHVRTHPLDQLEKDVLALAEPSNLKCLLCPEIFANYALLALHAKKVHTSQHECSQCHHMFKFYYELNRHIITRHSGLKPFMCSVCGWCFRSNSERIEHNRVHTNDRRFKCILCEQTFIQRGTLKDHMNKHRESNSFICTVCGKALSGPRILKVHMTIHTNKRPHKCNVCRKTFRLPVNLRDHLLSHSDVRIFECKQCKASFKLAGTLAKHMRIHLSEPLFSCTICKKGFHQKYNLKIHMRTHTKERPYVCSVCSQTFPHQGSWKKHFQSHSAMS